MKLGDWLTASRALFSITVVLPCLLGGVIAFSEGYINVPLLAITAVGLFFGNMTANFTNDYYDYLSGVDALDEGRRFKQGSEAVMKNGLTLQKVKASIAVAVSIVLAVGAYLLVFVDWRLIFFGVAGLFTAYFYTAPPFKLGYRGLGEVFSGIGCGPLPVIGTYFVLAHRISATAVVASIPVGILVAAILYIGNVPDVDADRQVGKRTISVRLGRGAVRFLGPAFYASIYLIIALGAVLGTLPIWTMLAFLTAPFTVKLLKTTSANYEDIPRYAPAIMMTVKVFTLTTVLMAAGFIIKVYV